jgi:hypothetical protein
LGFFNGVWSNNFDFSKIKFYIPSEDDLEVFYSPTDSLVNSLSSINENKNNSSGNEGDDENSI